MIALVVMMATGASSLGVQSLQLHAQREERSSGCHEHGSSSPSPRPASYQCCLTGHNTAVLPATHTAAIVHEFRGELLTQPSVSALNGSGLTERAIFSGDPPGATPLRI